MSRALLLVSLLAAPALAAAQVLSAGQVTFARSVSRDFPMYVNDAECANDSAVTVRWQPLLTGTYATAGTVPTGAQYQMWASNQDPTAQTGANANTCYTTPDQPSGRVVNQIVDPSNPNPIITTSATMHLATFVDLALVLDCRSSDGKVVYICIQGIDPANGNAKFGFASSAVTVALTHPPAPTIRSITPGDAALNVSWDAGAATSTYPADSYVYELTAVMVGTTTGASDPNTHTSSRFTATSARFDGLVNSVTYAVTAKAFSKADNPSLDSAPETGTPQVVLDFWEVYKDEFGGRDNGGCAGGPAGPLALVLVAGGLALLRRRK